MGERGRAPWGCSVEKKGKRQGGCCAAAGEGKERGTPWLLVDLGARERRGRAWERADRTDLGKDC
jgi:hypothetical protein